MAAVGLGFEMETAVPLARAAARSLVVLDAGLANQPGIAASFADAVGTITIDGDDDPLSLVTTELERLGGVSSIHVVTHGSPGGFTLGNTRFDGTTIDDTAAGLLAWNRLAGPGADLYLWGCDIAGGDGASLVDSIHALSGFDVAASIDVTGPAALGGDFDLEYAAGDVALPALVAGVDVLWETTLPDHTFTTASKTAMQSAFDRLNDTVAPAIGTALAGQTGSASTDNLAQRTISDLFTDATSISPADVQAFLELKAAASAYLANATPTLSGLAAAINTALATKATAAGAAAGSRTITVTPSVSGNLVTLQVSITATGTKQADVDLGTDALPTTWGSVVRTLNSDYGAVFRTTPKLETGTTATTGFTIQLDITNAGSPTATLAIASTNLAGGIYSFGPGIRFGILDATLGGQPTLPYSTTVSFGVNGPSRTIANWASPSASASGLGTPSTTLDLPITASIGGTAVTSATTKLRIVSTDPTGVIPPTITATDLGRLVWFGNLTSDELINAVTRVGGVYEAIGANERLDSSIPFVRQRFLRDEFAFADVFDEKIAEVIDVSVPVVMPESAGSGLTFTVAAGGTQITLAGDRRSDVTVGKAIGLIPSTPSAADAVIRTVNAVTLSGGNTLVTIDATIDGTTTGGKLVATTPVRPANLQTIADFQNYPAFAGLGITPVYDATNGTVSIQFATSRTAQASATPAVTFSASPLGAVTFSSGAVAGTTAVKLAFGIQFDIGPASPIVIGLGQPVTNGRLAADTTVTFTSGNDTWDVTVKAADTATNASFADLVADLNAARATARKVIDGTPEMNADRTAKLTDISSSFEFFSESTGTVSVRTTGASPTTLLSQQAIATLSRGRLTEDAVFTITPMGGSATTVTVTKTSTDENESLADLVVDVNAALGSSSILQARVSELRPVIEFYTPTVNASMPLGIKIEATRNQAALDLGFSDGIALTDGTKDTKISLFGRPTGVTSRIVPHADATKKFAESTLDWQLDGLAGTVGYGINTVAFATTDGDVDAGYSAVLAAAGGSAEAIVDGDPALLTDTFTGSAAVKLQTLSRVGATTNDIQANAEITIAIADLTKEKVDSFVDIGAALSVPGLEDSGRGTGRLSADAKIRFTAAGDTYEATVTAANAANNATFADLLSDFNQALTTARKIVDGTPSAQTFSLAGQFSVTGSGGRVSVLHFRNGIQYPVLENLLVPNLAAGGGDTGRLTTASSLSVIRGADTYTVTVPASATADNTAFASTDPTAPTLVADFNAALAVARRQLPAQAVPNLATNGATTGRLSANASLELTRGADTYTVTVLASATTNNSSFAQLVANFNAALETAQKETETGPVTVDARSLFVFSAGTSGQVQPASIEDARSLLRFTATGTAGRVQPQSSQEVVNPAYATVTTPLPASMGEIGYQAGLSVEKIAGALTNAARVFDMLERDLKEYTDQQIPFIGQPLADLIDLNGGLAGRIQAFGKLSASSPQELERALETSLGVPTSDLQIAYDSVRKAYRIDFVYRASKLASVPFDVDIGVYNALLGKPLPKGIDSLTDGDGKTPLSVVANATSVLSVGYDLVNDKTFLYGHDGTSDHGLTNGTSFRITFSVNGQNLQFPAKFGMDVRGGTAKLENGELVVELAGPKVEKQFTASGTTLTVDSTSGLAVGMAAKGTGIRPGTVISQINGGTQLTLSQSVTKATGFATFTSPSSRYEIFPGSGALAALDIDNYAAAFSGKARAIMPIFDAFAPANLTSTSEADRQASVDDRTFTDAHPASFYLAMPDLAGYFDAVNRLQEARDAISTLMAASKTVDANGIQLGNELDRLGFFGSPEYLRWRASWRGRLETAAEDLGGVLFTFAPELENARNLLGAQETLVDYIRDPAMILDKLNAAIGGVESALKGLNKIPLPFMEGKLAGAVGSIFSFRTGWLLDMRNKMRGAGEGIFDVMRQSVFEYLGPKHANILLKYDPVSMDRSLDSMMAATRPEDIGVVFMDKDRQVLSTDVRGADAFEIVFRLGQKVFDTGIDLGFKLDALESVGVGAAFDGGLRLQVGWEMLLGFGFSITDGFYLKVDSSGDANSRGNFSGSTGQFEAQLRFDATLTGASKNYTHRWDDDLGYWKIVDTKGTTSVLDDSDIIDALTNQPYRAIAVNNQATDVTSLVSTVPAEYDPCGCGEPPSATRTGQKIWWVVGTDSGNGSFVPAELNDQGMYVPQTSPYPHTLIEVTAMKPAQLAGSLVFLRLAATDKIRRGLSGFTDVDSQYFYDAGDGPQVTAEQRDDEATGVNRNNELPTRFSAAVGLNIADPSASAGRKTVREEANAPGGTGSRRVVDPFGKEVAGDSGAIAKPGTAWAYAPLFWQQSEIAGVYAKEFYEFKLKVAPPAKYDALDLPVRLATGGNIALRGMGIIDGVQVKVGDRVLVKSQALAEENGVYIVSAGGWSRALDANDNHDFNAPGKPMFVLVEEGRTNAGTGWNLRDDTGTVTLGTTPLYFERTMVAIREPLPKGLYLTRLVPYEPFIVLPIRADLIEKDTLDVGDIHINIEYNAQNYIIVVSPALDGGTGLSLRTVQLNQALATAKPAQFNDKGEVEEVPNSTSSNLFQAGFAFVMPTAKDKKWYRIAFPRLKEVDGKVSRQATRSGTFVDYGTPTARDAINQDSLQYGSGRGWDPVADINADASPGRITWREFKDTSPKKIFQVDFHADAVANLTLELSIGDTASSQNLLLPRIYADFNLDWSTRAARARIDKAKADSKDQDQAKTQGTSQPADDDGDMGLKALFAEEDEKTQAKNAPGGDPGIDPSSPLLKEMDLKPEIGFNNIRLDLGGFLTKFVKPVIDKAEPQLERVRPVLQFFNSRIPVLSDVAGRSIKVVDLLEAYGGPKGKTVRVVIDVLTAIDNLVAKIAALPPGVNVQIPMGRFWFPKQFDDPNAINGRAPAPGSQYKYGSMVYDNLALGYSGKGAEGENAKALAALAALRETNPDSDKQKKAQGIIPDGSGTSTQNGGLGSTSKNAANRGGIRVPIIDDPLNLFQLMMGQTATLVTFQLPKLNYEFEREIPLVRIVCFEVGLRARFELDSNLAFGFDTYGINQYLLSGDLADIAQGFYVSDRANADGTGADIPEFKATASLGLYGGIDVGLAKAGVEGGLTFIGEVNLNDPNNDGKLRFTEVVGLLQDTHNPLDLFDLSLRGEVYARYYYKVGIGKLAISGGKTFARLELFNLVREGSDGAPIYASRLDGTDGDAIPGTLQIHVGEAAAKRVSNQDPLNARDGAEKFKIWNSGETVTVQYLNYDPTGAKTKTWNGVKLVLFDGGIGDDELDASGLNGIPLIFKGGDGNDKVWLGSGHGSTVSRLEGDDGNDTIIVNGGGVVELVGGVGNDIVTGGTGIVRIEGGEGNDTVTTRAGSTSTIVMAEDYGLDTAALAADALQNLLDFTSLASAIEILLDAALGATADGTAKAGDKNKLTFNAAGVTEIRGSSQDDTFTLKNPRTRNANRVRLGVTLKGASSLDLPEVIVPFLAADGATTGKLAADSAIAIDIGKYTYTVTVPKTTADDNTSVAHLVADFNAARASASRQDRTNPSASPTTVNASSLFDFFLPNVFDLSGLLLRGGQGDDLYDLTLNTVGDVAANGIVIDDVQAVVPAKAGTVETCGTCKEIKSIAVAAGGKGYELPPEVMIVDPTGSGAKATAVIDDEGRVTAIQIIEGGSGYTAPQALLIAPRSLNDKLVLSSTLAAATLSDATPSESYNTLYRYTVGGKTVRFMGWGDARRPVGLDQSEIDSVTVNLPEGVLTLDSRVNLFQTFKIDASRMVQNARVVADTIDIETDHGFQVRYPLHAVNSGDVKIRVTANGTSTGEGADLNATANRAAATAVVSAGGVTSLAIANAGSKYFFTPSITVGADGATPGTGARFAATLAGNGGGLPGFTRLSPGSGYYASPAPIVVIPPPASIQIDAMITSSTPNNPGLGDGRGRVLLFADTGMVSTSGEVYFPTDTRAGQPQGSRTIDWIGGDFRYRTMVGLDDIVSPTTYPGVSVGTGAEFTAVLDADGRVTGFTPVLDGNGLPKTGSGYTRDLPPLVEIEGLATAVPVVGSNGEIVGLSVTYPGDGYGQPPRVTIKPNGFGRIVDSPNGVGSGMTADGRTPMNRAHIRSIGGTLVAVAGAGVGDPLKPIKSDVEKLVAQVTVSGGVHVLEKDGLRIGKDQSVSGITTVNGDVSITTFGGTLELGAPRQAVDEQGRLLWQDAAKTIPIYDRDPVTGRILYEGGDIRVGRGNVKLTADDVEVNVDLNGSGGTGTITLQPVNVKAEIGLAGTRARIEGTITDGRLTGFDTTKFWGGRGYTTAPLVIVDPAGQRAFASAVVEAGKVTAIDVLFGGTNYDPDDPPVVTLTGGGISGSTPLSPATATAIVGADGVITGFTITNAGSGYFSAPSVSIASPGQALVQAVLDTVKDPVSGRFSVKEFVITNPGRNYQAAPYIEVAAPYDFTLDADEVNKFAGKFAQVVIGRIEGQHLFHSPEANYQGTVVLRAPRAGGTLDMASFTTTGPVSIVGSGNTFHFDAANAAISGTSISIDDNVIVHKDVSGTATATTGSIVVFGTGKGMIDGDPDDNDNDAIDGNEDLLLTARTNVLVTGAVGSRWKLDDLTVRSGDYVATPQVRDSVVFEQSVGLTGNLTITGSAVTIGGVVDVDGNLVIDASSMVSFGSDVTVDGNLVITGATGITFGGRLTVGGSITISGVTGTVRFGNLVTANADLSVTATTLIDVAVGMQTAGDVTLRSNEIEFRGGTASIAGAATKTLTLQPHTTSRQIRVGTPSTGSATNSLDVSDADLAAIAPGWGGVVIGDATNGTGSVTIGSIGTQQGVGNSWLASSTTIVGGSVTVTQKVDAAIPTGELFLRARTGDVTVNAAINETATDRSATVSIQAAGAIAINAAVSSVQDMNLTSGGTTSQTTAAPLATRNLRIDSQGAVSLLSPTNAFDLLAVATSNDNIAIREDSGYEIGAIAGVIGIQVGTATATLISSGRVTQAYAIDAGRLELQGAGGQWVLTAGNSIGMLTADTGSLSVSDAAQLNVGSLVSSQQSGTAITLSAPTGLSLTAAITTAGGDVVLNNAVTLTTDIAIDVEDGANKGTARFLSTVNATTAGQQSLAVTGKLNAGDSIGATTALKSLSVSNDATLASGSTFRTTGGQTYSGGATSSGTITIQAGSGAAVKFLGATSLGGLVTSTSDTAAYDVELTGSNVTVTNAVTFANTGTVKLGDQSTDDLLFVGGVTSTAPAITKLAGTVRTTDAAGSFGRKPGGVVELIANTTVSTGLGNATFGGTVDGPYRLDVNATGDTTFSSAVGGGTALTHLETDAPGRTLIDGGSVRTASPSSQVYNDDVLLGANTVLTAENGGGVTFVKTLNGGYTLAVNTTGTTTFGGTVGNGTPLKSLTTDAGGTTRINGSAVITNDAGGQVYNDAVEIGVADAILAAGTGPVTFNGTVNSAAGGARALTVNTAGTTTFTAAVGTTRALESLTTDANGTTAINGGAVTTSGAAGQVYNDAVEIGVQNATLAAGTGPVTFNGTVNSATGGARALTVNTSGTTTFAAAVGTTRVLESLTTDANGTTAINGGAVSTSGAAGQVYNDAVEIGVQNATLAAGTGPVTFNGTINSATGTARALTVNTAGTTTFTAAVGTTRALESLATNALGSTRISGGTITTSGSAGQVFGDAVVLLTDTTLNAGSGAVTFAASVDGPGSLTVNTTGVTTFTAAVGGGTPLAAITTNAGGTSQVNGGLVRTMGAQSWLDNVVMPIDTLFHSVNGVITGGPANTFSAPGRAVTFNAGAGIGGANPLRIAAGSVVATITGQTGGIALTGVGDLVIGAGGLLANGPIVLDASGEIRVPTGGTIAHGPVTTTKPIRWSVIDTTDNAADPVPGSLRHVLTRANAIGNANPSGPDAVIVFSSLPNPTRFVLQAQLPAIAAGVQIDGGNTIVIDGNRAVQHGITFGPQAAGSLLKGVTLQNFTNYGIQLLAAPSVTVQDVTVRSLNTETSMGLYATGDLTGTRVIGSTFSGGLRGALLDNARNLVFGQIGTGLGNTLSNNLSAPGRLDFAGTGIRAQGLLTGTVVAGNTFTGNNYGFAFIGAQNLRLERNLFTRNNIAGIYVEGDSRGSVQTGNSFGVPRQDRNKVNVLRARGSQFGGPAVVQATQIQPVVVQRNR